MGCPIILANDRKTSARRGARPVRAFFASCRSVPSEQAQESGVPGVPANSYFFFNFYYLPKVEGKTSFAWNTWNTKLCACFRRYTDNGQKHHSPLNENND